MHFRNILESLRQRLSLPVYVKASLVVSLAGLLNGLDTGTIGPVTAMPSFATSLGILTPALHGLVVSIIMLSAAISSPFSGILSDNLGRKVAVGVGALVFALGAALEAAAVNLIVFIVGRLIVGVGEGLFLSTLIVYICEISPPQQRGSLASTAQLLITIGLVLGYFVSYGTIQIASSMSWRIPLIFQSFVAVALTLGCFFYIPESPRWLSFKGRRQEANGVWDRLGVMSAEREKDEELISTGPARPAQNWRQRFSSTLKVLGGKVGRKQMVLGIFLMCMQQLSGVDGVLFYAPLLFQQAGITSAQAAFLASGLSAILIFLVTIPAFLLADRWGRRSSTIQGGVFLTACMILMGSLYASNSVHADYGAARWVVIVTIYLFAAAYSMTWALGIKIFASEIQPLATRATVTSLAQSGNCITNFFVALITPIILAKSSSGAYFLFGGSTLLVLMVCVLFMPETRGHSLEAIDESFRTHRISDGSAFAGVQKLMSRVQRLCRRTQATSSHVARPENIEGLELNTRTVTS